MKYYYFLLFLLLSISLTACKKKIKSIDVVSRENDQSTDNTSAAPPAAPNPPLSEDPPPSPENPTHTCNIDNTDMIVKNGVLTQWKSGKYYTIIPSCVQTIARNAFKNTTVQSISIPETVTKIETEAFSNSQLTDIYIIGNPLFEKGAFKNAQNLTYIFMPDWKGTEVPESLFENCSQLNKDINKIIKLPASVKKIGVKAFKGCTALTNITMPEVTEIDTSAFEECIKLTGNNILFSKITAIKAFAFKNSGIKILDIHPVLTELGVSAFENCIQLKSVTFSAGMPLKTLPRRSFFGCTALQNFALKAIEKIEEEAFNNCTALTSVHLGMIKDIGAAIFNGCTALKIITLETQAIPKVTDKTATFFGTLPQLKNIGVPDKIGSNPPTIDLINKYKAEWTGYADKIKGNSTI